MPGPACACRLCAPTTARRCGRSHIPPRLDRPSIPGHRADCRSGTSLEKAPHLGALVRILGWASVNSPSRSGLAPKFTAVPFLAVELLQSIVNPVSDAGRIQKDSVRLVFPDLRHDMRGNLHQVGDAELHGRDRAGVEPRRNRITDWSD